MSRILTALSCLAAASVAVATCAHAFETVVTAGSDEMGYIAVFSGWGAPICNTNGANFAPPRNATLRALYKSSFPSSNIVDGWVGIEFNTTGDPEYYIVDGRFKGCLYNGYPFGDMSPYWNGGVVDKAAGQVKWESNELKRVDPSGTILHSHCIKYHCNNEDDCFGNGLSVTGTWPSCSCGGCVAGVSGPNCNKFTIGDSAYTINGNLSYGTPDTMRATCEASGLTLFSTTSNQTEWNLLQSYLPSTYRFFVGINNLESRDTWKNSNGDIVSNSSTFNSPFFGVWGSGEGTSVGEQCVDMMGGELYQSNCTGNRYFICVPMYTTTTTTTTPAPTNATTMSNTTADNTTTTMANSTANNSTKSNSTDLLDNVNGVAASVSTVAAIVVMVICAALF